SKNWEGIPLVSAAVIVNLIGATKTQTGLSINCVLDESDYKTGLEVTDEEFETVLALFSDFHGEWNYTICHHI
ncbi:MAG: ISAzo13 family transposase, partial [Synergistaceae bacterium]|nr:ISAzo13 family transposase [Synergistaceae bacterium]